MIEKGRYGPVLCLRGRHRGRVGYYDNDEGNGAIVYFGVPFEDEYVIVPYSWLEPTDTVPLGLARWIARDPGLADLMGVSMPM